MKKNRQEPAPAFRDHRSCYAIDRQHSTFHPGHVVVGAALFG